jgi:hypothetical protein
MRLENKVAIVTGAASGMGAATARRFAKEGAKVVVADMLEAEGKQVAAEIVKAGGTAEFMALSVTDEENWKALVAATVAKWGKLDILVNNAGISGSAVNDLLETGIWERVMSVNATGVFLGTAWLSTLASAWLNPEAWSLGASGGGYGLTGALIGTLAAGPLLVGWRSQALLLAAAALIGLHIAQGGAEADKTAHGAGLLIGFLLGAALAGRTGPVPKSGAQRRLVVSAALGAMALIVSAEARQWLLVEAVEASKPGAGSRVNAGVQGCRWVRPPGWVERAPTEDTPQARCMTNGLADACLIPGGDPEALEAQWFGNLDCPPGERRPDAAPGETGWHLRRRSQARRSQAR